VFDEVAVFVGVWVAVLVGVLVRVGVFVVVFVGVAVLVGVSVGAETVVVRVGVCVAVAVGAERTLTDRIGICDVPKFTMPYQLPPWSLTTVENVWRPVSVKTRFL